MEAGYVALQFRGKAEDTTRGASSMYLVFKATKSDEMLTVIERAQTGREK